MTPAVVQFLEEVERFSASERVDLADRLVESLADEVPPAILQSQITEVRRRIAEVEAGKVALIPGEEALAQVRRLVSSSRGRRLMATIYSFHPEALAEYEAARVYYLNAASPTVAQRFVAALESAIATLVTALSSSITAGICRFNA